MKKELDKLTQTEREDIEQVMQMYADKYGGVVTFVTKNKEHFCFSAKLPTKLSDVIMPRSYLEEGE